MHVYASHLSVCLLIHQTQLVLKTHFTKSMENWSGFEYHLKEKDVLEKNTLQQNSAIQERTYHRPIGWSEKLLASLPVPESATRILNYPFMLVLRKSASSSPVHPHYLHCYHCHTVQTCNAYNALQHYLQCWQPWLLYKVKQCQITPQTLPILELGGAILVFNLYYKNNT